MLSKRNPLVRVEETRGKMIDTERQQRIQDALHKSNLDALVCGLPTNVLMITGYWPVTGISVTAVSADGRVITVVPEDEHEFARTAAGEVRTYAPASLERIISTEDAVVEPLGRVLSEMRLESARIGYEASGTFVPVPYTSVHAWGVQLHAILSELLPNAGIVPADCVLGQLRSTLTPHEVQCVRQACEVAGRAFDSARERVRAGVTERELAGAAGVRLSITSAERAGGFLYCMSGPNSADAYRAFQYSTNRAIGDGDLVLVHCNSYVNGYWTDITRTYCLGRMDERKREVYDAVLAAREAALAAVRPGARASDVDAIARRVMDARGYKKQFKHPTGHGVGFAAIDHNAMPHIHPASNEILQRGMVFNIEPAAYFDGWGGVRHCDVVAVTEDGAELLTPFDSDLESLSVLV